MNSQEAITLLRNLEDALDSYCELNEEGKTAFRMAIEALSCSDIPNSSDTISRQQEIDALDTAIEHYDGIAEECRKKADIERNDYMDMRDDAYEARQLAQWLNELKYLREKIEQLTIKPEPQWIPCSERMPEKTPLWKTVGYLATVTCDSWEEPRTMYVKWETTTVRGKEVSRWTFDNRLFPSEWRVVAWMPLPEAYKKGGERI